MPTPLPSSPSFTFLMTMVSVVLSLGLTHLITGTVQLFQPPGRARLSLVHGGWTVFVFALILDMWLSLWSLRLKADWDLSDFILILLGVILLYVVVVLVTAPREGPVDLAEFHARNSRRYLSAAVVYELWGAWVNVFVLPDNFNVADLFSTVPMLLCLLAAIVWSNVWVQRAAVAGALAVTAYYFAVFFGSISA